MRDVEVDEQVRAGPVPEGHDRLTIAAVAAVAFAAGIAVHLGVTAFLAARFGATPDLIASTGLAVDWSRLDDDEVILAGATGTLASGLLATVGWLVVRRSRGRPGTGALLGWLTFSFNAWLVSAWLLVSSVAGVGVWMAIVDRFADRGPLRASVAAAGLFLVALTWKESVPSLAWTTGNGNAEVRQRRARVVTRTAWLAGGLVSLAAAAWVPVDATRSLLVVLGALVATAPMMRAAGGVGEHPVRGEPLRVSRSWLWIVAGACAAGLFVAVLGRGVVAGPAAG